MSLAAAVESFLCGLPPIIMAPVFGSYCRHIRHHQEVGSPSQKALEGAKIQVLRFPTTSQLF